MPSAVFALYWANSCSYAHVNVLVDVVALALALVLLLAAVDPLLVAQADSASADPASRARAFAPVLFVLKLRSFLAVCRGRLGTGAPEICRSPKWAGPTSPLQRCLSINPLR